MRAARCRSCGAWVYWGETENGKKMPVDAEPVTTGLRFLLDDSGHLEGKPTKLVRVVEPKENPHGQPGHASHFATCPEADAHRRSR